MALTTGKVFNIAAFNAKSDASIVSDGVIDADSLDTVTSATGFTGAVVGMLIEVEGAGAAGAVHTSTIASVTDLNTLVMTNAALSAVSSVHVGYGTNNATALRAAAVVASAVKGTVEIPPGTFYVSSWWTGNPAVLDGLDGVTFTGTWGSVLKVFPGNNNRALRFQNSTNLKFVGFAIDHNGAQRANAFHTGLSFVTGNVGIEITGMHIFDSRAEAAQIGGNKDRWAILFGSPTVSQDNINIHHNLIEDGLQIEIHGKNKDVKVTDNLMVNTKNVTRTTAAIWTGSENVDALQEDFEIARNLIMGYKSRGILQNHTQAGGNGTYRRYRIHGNTIIHGFGTTAGAGIQVGIANSSLNYTGTLIFEDIFVDKNYVKILDTVTSGLQAILFNATSLVDFVRGRVKGNTVVKEDTILGINGIQTTNLLDGRVVRNKVKGFRNGFILRTSHGTLIEGNHVDGIEDAAGTKTFNGFNITGSAVAIRDNEVTGVIENKAFAWH